MEAREGGRKGKLRRWYIMETPWTKWLLRFPRYLHTLFEHVEHSGHLRNTGSKACGAQGATDAPRPPLPNHPPVSLFFDFNEYENVGGVRTFFFFFFFPFWINDATFSPPPFSTPPFQNSPRKFKSSSLGGESLIIEEIFCWFSGHELQRLGMGGGGVNF